MYRGSIFKTELRNQFLIAHVVFSLQRFDESYQCITSYPDIEQVLSETNMQLSPFVMSKIISEIRASKLPDHTKIGTAGSVFANPLISKPDFSSLQEQYPTLKHYPHGEQLKLSAGQLIDLAGLKGYSNGKAGTSPQHALIVVNQ